MSYKSNKEYQRLKALLMHLRQAKFRLDAAAAYSERAGTRRLNALALKVEEEIQNQARLLPAHADDPRWKASGPDGEGFPAYPASSYPAGKTPNEES